MPRRFAEVFEKHIAGKGDAKQRQIRQRDVSAGRRPTLPVFLPAAPADDGIDDGRQVPRAAGMVGAAGPGHPGAAAAHVPAKDAHTPRGELFGEAHKQRRAVMVGQAMGEDRHLPARGPSRGAIVMDGERVAVGELDAPQQCRMIGELLWHKRRQDRLHVRILHPPRRLEG